MNAVRLSAPLAGWAAPLDEVPDPVFAERMMGEGIAIDPLDGLLRAPCDGQLVAFAPTGHSVSLRLDNGAELLIHVGLDTVMLKGEGFSVLASDGTRVREGDPLIRFDLALLADRAKSLITPMVIVNPGYAIQLLACDRVVGAGDPLMMVNATGAAASNGDGASGDTAHREIRIPMANGVHARPAARIAAALKPFMADLCFAAHGREANGRSAVALMTLGLKHGDVVAISGKGADARAAVAAVVALIETGMGEGHASAAGPATVAMAVPAAVNDEAGPVFRGVCAASGMAIGPVAQFRPAELDIMENGTGIAVEAAALEQAIASVAAELDGVVIGDKASIAAAHKALLEDPALLMGAREAMARGKSAAFAWRAAIRAQAAAIRATGDALLIDRVADLTDLERRITGKLLGVEVVAMPSFPAGTILIADELLPSEFMALDAASLGGVVMARGGPTSHVAILAGSAAVPMLVAAGTGVLGLANGMQAILDAGGGMLDSAPSPRRAAVIALRRSEAEERRAAALAAATVDCVMADGTRIEVFANLASVEDAAHAVGLGAEGCGLLRSEFLFLDRDSAPSEEEQREIYGKIARALGGRPLIVRTLDIGGDKPVPYLPFPHEENPALGNRGIRLGLSRPDMLSVQLRAILSGVPAAQCRVMLPMIVDVEELRTVRRLLDDAAQAVGIERRVPLGAMVETPSAAMLADSIATEADFLSVGTNDLTQYALAADRGNPAVAAKIDALHPAVLRLIGEAGRGAAKHQRWFGVCGGLASDPDAAAVLIGLGVTELSATPAAIPAVKDAVRRLTMDRCRSLAARALAAASAAEVRALLVADRGEGKG